MKLPALAIEIIIAVAILAALLYVIPALGIVVPDVVVKLVWIAFVAWLAIRFVLLIAGMRPQG